MKQCYQPRNFKPASLERIATAEAIINEYAAQGYDLTLRQLYYQFVARALIDNTDKEYKRLGALLNNARLAGLIDWSSIVDRTRSQQCNPHWSSPRSILRSCAASYAIDKWSTQVNRVEVWIEKDALVGVIAGVCDELDVPYFSCRGYASQSSMWAAAQRFQRHCENDQQPIVLHLGDHDPSGLDMTRDIDDRLDLFLSADGNACAVHRIALTMAQINEHNPPSNPAKLSDNRCAAYIEEFGDRSWELDALEPQTIEDLIREHVLRWRVDGLWQLACEREDEQREQLRAVARHWDRIDWSEFE